MSDQWVKGSCLCGEIEYEVAEGAGTFQYCRCSRCRKATGSAFASNILVSPEQFRWTKGEMNVGRHEVIDAKHFATCFCKTCGSFLPWATQSGAHVIVPAGTLDEDPGIKPIQTIFCASGASWYQTPDSLPQFDTLPEK